MTFKVRFTVVEISFWFVAVLTLILVFTGQNNGIWCFLMCIFHELGHLIMMLIFRKKPRKIELGYFGMKIISGERMVSPLSDILIAAAGPAVNILLSYVFHLLKMHNMAQINLALAIFNLLPVNVLDGGRILSAVTDNYRLLKKIGLFTSVLLCFAGAAVALYNKKNCILLIVSLYLLIGILSEK